jgi:3-oxoacyl-[acyl-carrier-protein] synthase-1/3-oxoacyl-[acyl-carrier-protein] synthase II
VGVALGTSSGGMLSAERLFRTWADGATPSTALLHRATYFAPFRDGLRSVGIDAGSGTGWAGWERMAADLGAGTAELVVPTCFTQVLAACASSTLAIGLGMRWL